MVSATAGRITSAVSQQAPHTLVLVGTTSTAFQRSIFGFDHLQAMATQLRVDEAPTTPVIGQLARRMFVESAELDLRIKNQTSGQVNLSVYDVVARRDRSIFVAADTDWQQGVTETVDPGSSLVNGWQTPGSTPFQSAQFTQFWVVKKRTQFTLHAGSEHVHHVRYVVNRLVNTAMTSDIGLIKGLSMQVMVVMEGPIAETSVGSNVGLAEAALNYVARCRTKFSAMEKGRTIFTNWQNLAVGTVVDQMVEDTDAPAPVTTA